MRGVEGPAKEPTPFAETVGVIDAARDSFVGLITVAGITASRGSDPSSVDGCE